MTYLNSKTYTLPKLSNFIGGDTLFNELDRLCDNVNPSFPSYNLVKVGEKDYRLELALAGYTESDIDITVEKDRLIVSSDGSSTDTDEEILYRGIAKRKFRSQWKMHQHLEVASANFENGMLFINLAMKVPEEDKPRKIAIGRTVDKQLLTESEEPGEK